MTKIIGRLINLGLARQTDRLVTESAATFWVPKTTYDFNPRTDYAVNQSSLGVIDGRTDAKPVEKLGEGSFGGIMYANSGALLWYAALGTLSSGSIIDSAYIHTISRLNSNQHPLLTIFEKSTNQDVKYGSAAINQFTMNCALKDYVRYTAGFLSKTEETASSTATYSADKAFLAQHITVKLATTTGGLAAASAISVRGLNLTVNKNVEDWQELGSLTPADLVNKEFTVSGDMTLSFDSEVYKDYVIDGTKMAALITIENTDDLIGVTSTAKLDITLAPMTFRDWNRGTGQGDVVTQTVGFDGNFGISDSKTISATFRNSTVSY